MSAIHNEVEVWAGDTQLTCDLTPSIQTIGRQTAFVGSKVLCYLLGTIYSPLQLNL